MAEPVVIERHDDLAELILNRPEVYNAFDLDMAGMMAHRFAALASDESVLGVAVTGRGRAFCAGGDLKWVGGGPARPAAALHALAGQFHAAIVEIRRMPKPVVAAVNGPAAGGGFSLALACDFRVMERSAFLKQAYTSSGLCIDGGGTHVLPRLVGLARAMEIAAFDQPISAEAAHRLGLATQVVEDGAARVGAIDLLRRLLKRSQRSFARSKALLADSFSTPLETHIERERAALCECAAHADAREGLRAFAEKRAPVFGRG